jgi:xanthine dehydrogenase accessory factor
VELHKSVCPSGGTIEVFVEPILPRPVLIVAGGAPVARTLAALGLRAGFAVTVAALPEDQTGFAEADARIEGFDLTRAPGIATGYVVVATQGKRDREALAAALTSGAPYVAFVGSRKKSETLRAAMAQMDVPAEQIGSLHAPAGLDIGAATPEEIALSILAEIVQERRQAARSDLQPRVQIEDVDGGSMESRIVSPAQGTCHGNDGRH